ncbi:MAG: hypothetical protein ACYDBJ_02625 [Aggregatilineales bacterium]
MKRVRAGTNRKKSKARSTNESESDPVLALSPGAALALFSGQPVVTLESVAQALQVDSALLSDRYSDVGTWLTALLRAHNPIADFNAALDSVTGEAADELLRDAMRRLIDAAQRNAAYFELALIEADRYQGGTLVAFGAGLLPGANVVFARIKNTGQLRPLPDWIVARALVSLFIGFIASERAMPQVVRTASRLLPQRAWIDGLTDIMLYGLLEDDARE